MEVKNSDIGAGAKVPHLSYIGDADVGEETNLGAGTITANYDGRASTARRSASACVASVDTSFVAPVTVGDDAYTALGRWSPRTCLPARWPWPGPRQENIEGYAERRRSNVYNSEKR